MEVLAGLSNRVSSDSKSGGPPSPFIFTLLKKCTHYKIPYELMCRLNYNDLLYMIVNYDIDTLNKYLHEKEQASRQKKGIDVIDASPQMATAFFKGG